MLIEIAQKMTNYNKSNRRKHGHYPKRRAKQERNPKFIYAGDLCFFKETELVYPANENFEYSKDLLREVNPNEHIFYVKRTRKNRKDSWKHCIKSYGLNYVFEGSIKALTKKQNHEQNKTI